MTLSIYQICQLIGFAVMLAGGQTLFKLAALNSAALTTFSGLFGLAMNIWFWLALIIYGGATLLWIYILQNVPLSLAYPFVALGFIFVPAIAFLFFKEPVNIQYFAGLALILGGLAVITVFAPK